MKLGPHTKCLNWPANQRQQARDRGWTAFQTHLGSPQTLQLPAKEKCGITLEKAGTPQDDDPIWVVHACYLAHSCPKGPIEAVTAKYIKDTLALVKEMHAHYLVLHIGGTKDRSALDVIDSIKAFLNKSEIDQFLGELNGDDYKRPVKLLLENVAANYAFNRSLRNLHDVVGGYYDLGWCLDTAHAHAAGIEPIKVREVIQANPPNVCHANFPGSLFGSGRDRHGWRYLLTPECGPDPTGTAEEYDKTIRLLNSLDVPLILEGGSYDGDSDKEVDFVRNLLK